MAYPPTSEMAGRELRGYAVPGLDRRDIGQVGRLAREARGIHVLDPFRATAAGRRFIDHEVWLLRGAARRLAAAEPPAIAIPSSMTKTRRRFMRLDMGRV